MVSGAGHDGQWAGEAHHFEASRLLNRHKVRRAGQPLGHQVE